MAFANINLKASVPEKSLSVYGAGVGQYDVCPSGVVMFGIAQVALTGAESPQTVYIGLDGNVTTSAGANTLKAIVECDAAVGEGVWVKVFGTTADGSAFVLPTAGA